MIARTALFLVCAFTSLWAELDVGFETMPEDQAVIVGETVQFEAINYGVVPFVDYQWDFGDGTTAQGVTVSHQFQNLGPHLVKLTPIDASGTAGQACFQMMFVNPTLIPRELWYAHIFGEINVPAEPEMVLQIGSQTRFEATSQADAARYIWHVEGTAIVFEGQVWDWTVPEELAPDRYRLVMTAIHQDGTATPFPESRQLFFYRDEPPPDGLISNPQPDADGLFRMAMGTQTTFEASAIYGPNSGPGYFRWDIQAYGPLEAGFCNDYNLENNEPFFGDTFVFEPTRPGYYCLSLIAVDSNDVFDPFSFDFQVIVKGENRPPQGEIATLSQTTNVGESVTLTATGSDPDNDPLTFCWDLGDGCVLEGETITVQFDEAGAYPVYLTARDSSGAVDPTPFGRWLMVNDPELEPINAEPFTAISNPTIEAVIPINTTLAVTGTGFDFDGDQVTLFWDLGNGQLQQGVDQIAASYDQPGYFDIHLFGRDAKGFAWRGFDELSIYAFNATAPPNGQILEPQRPTGDGEAYQDPTILVKPGAPITLKGTVMDVPDLSGYTARWSISRENTVPQFRNGFEPAPLVLEEPGDYYVSFRVEDPQGVFDPFEDFLFLSVATNFEPEGYIIEPGYDLGIRLNEGLTLAGAGFDLDQEPLCFEWSLSDGRTFKGERLENIRFSEPGLYSLRLTIRDPQDASYEVPGNVYITVWPTEEDQAFYPYVDRLSPAPFRVSGPRNSRFRFEVGLTDKETDAAYSEFFWDFSNGQTANTAAPGPIQFTMPGYYLVRLYVRNQEGLWSMYPETWEVVIYGDNLPPDGTIISPPLRDREDFYAAHTIPVLINEPVVLSATASDADGNFPLVLSWHLDYESFSFLPEPEPLVFEQRGFYKVGIDVFDAEFESDPLPDFRIIQVVDPDLKPESYIVNPDGDITVEPGEEIWFFGFGEDPNELEMEYTWEFGPLASPSSATGEEVYPVVFSQETPPDQPIVVTFTAKTMFTQDPTPATVRVHVRKFQDSDFEPNNSLSQAMSIGQGNYSSLSLQGDDPRDIYEFVVTQENRDLQIRLNANDFLQLNLYQFVDGQWQRLELDGLRSGQDTVTLQALAAGRYALELAANGDGGSIKRNVSYGLSINTLQPSLYMPFTVEDGSLSTMFGLVNPNSSQVDLAIAGLDETGRVVETKTMSLAPGERLFKPTLGFFDRQGTVEKAREVRWIKVLSTQRLVGFTNSETLDKTQMMSSAAIDTLQPSVLVPHIAENTNLWYTRAVLINASEKSQNLDFAAPSQNQTLNQLPPNHQSDFRFTDIFNQALPTWGQFSHATGQPGLAGIEIFGRVDGAKQMAGLEMIDNRRNNPNFTYVGNQIYFAHVAQDTTNFWTGIALINPNDTVAGYQLIGYDQNGVEVTRLSNQTLQPGGKLLNTVANIFGPDRGIAWLRVEADSGVAGFQLFGDYAGNRMAGFPAANFATDNLVFPHLTQKPDEWTGIAVLNVGENPVNITIEAFSDLGVPLATTTSTLQPRTKTVALPNNLFDEGLPPEACYLVIRGDQKTLNGFEIFGTLNPGGGLGEVMAGLSAQTP